MLSKEIFIQERRNERISAAITTVIMVVLLLLAMLWIGQMSRTMTVEMKEYEAVAAFDFGDYTNGSRNVNNYQKPTPTPQETPTQEAAPSQAEVSETNPSQTEHITSEAPSDVVEPDPPVVDDPTPDPPKTVTPTETQPTETDNSNQQQQQTLDDDLLYEASDSPSGSNQGTNDSGTGNQGSTDLKKLDPKGMYDFGSGSDNGLNGRQGLSLGYPNYDCQEEGQVTFEFYVRTDGSVSSVKTVGVVNTPCLKRRGIEAIRKWKFSKVSGNREQRLRVTIRFKLAN
ncbi:energy transducer TonB [Pontibacter sp. G13]|uniref:energy transducer TonB family protein n=1 Tax=Pontibacter sp. G13 TaxID=3074898 RepID=UPI00288BDB47|nr:energy transducer TonB [Pontibacter sp. G13]WNJ16550.1 energy transducer TonB [Pontibacter sp. G13]